jgi:hypothetical protein
MTDQARRNESVESELLDTLLDAADAPAASAAAATPDAATSPYLIPCNNSRVYRFIAGRVDHPIQRILGRSRSTGD